MSDPAKKAPSYAPDLIEAYAFLRAARRLLDKEGEGNFLAGYRALSAVIESLGDSVQVIDADLGSNHFGSINASFQDLPNCGNPDGA